jgi:hypothetical protein
MIRLLFVGDGERDAATNPHLVSTIITAAVQPTSSPWARLNRAGHGYDRKLLFAIRQARAHRLDGVVASVDRDTSRHRDRLRELEAARTRDREAHPPLPAALGCADPHAEAWLLDDPVAVRCALRLAGDTPIPTVRQVDSPKTEIDRLQRASSRCDELPRDVLVDIARELSIDRCQHARETGFAHFVDDVRAEIGPLARNYTPNA